MIRASIVELYHYRELLWMWTLRSIKARYQQTVLGAAWAILQPLALTLIYAVVFAVFIKVDTGEIPYPRFVYAGLLPWTLFASSVTLGVPTIVQNMDLVTKIYFPREVLPIAAIGIPAVDAMAGAVVLLVFTLIYGFPLSSYALFVPGLIVLQVLFTLGLLLYGSALNVLFRDVGHLVPPALLVWQFATPIIYPLELVPERFRSLYLLNPMAILIDSYRRVLLRGLEPQWEYLFMALFTSLILLVTGYWFFKKAERTFADVI